MTDEGASHDESNEIPSYSKDDLVDACEKKKIQEMSRPTKQQKNMGTKRPSIDDE